MEEIAIGWIRRKALLDLKHNDGHCEQKTVLQSLFSQEGFRIYAHFEENIRHQKSSLSH